MELVPIYTVVEARSINDLVKLTNMKTKDGWNFLGGMCHCPNNFCESDSKTYPYCQSMYRQEKPKKEKLPPPVKQDVAFPKVTLSPTVKQAIALSAKKDIHTPPLPTGRLSIIEQRIKNNKEKQKKYAPNK